MGQVGFGRSFRMWISSFNVFTMVKLWDPVVCMMYSEISGVKLGASRRLLETLGDPIGIAGGVLVVMAMVCVVFDIV